jgi:hypothetical protein
MYDRRSEIARGGMITTEGGIGTRIEEVTNSRIETTEGIGDRPREDTGVVTVADTEIEVGGEITTTGSGGASV